MCIRAGVHVGPAYVAASVTAAFRDAHHRAHVGQLDAGANGSASINSAEPDADDGAVG